jgi:hypothetical protein
LNVLDLNEPKGYYLISSTSSIYRSVAMILFHQNGMLGREQTGGAALFAQGGAMAADREGLNLPYGGGISMMFLPTGLWRGGGLT